jgi:hypothetical protein
MSVSKKALADSALVKRVAETYRAELLTVGEVAKQYGVTLHTARAMIAVHMTDEVFDKLKTTRYAASKLAEKNPQYGRAWASDCVDADGYLTRLVDGVRYLVHRLVAANLLGFSHPSMLPTSLIVHHIDENKLNNEPDNLAITTRAGHMRIHERYQMPGEDLLLKKLSVRECIEYMTSK